MTLLKEDEAKGWGVLSRSLIGSVNDEFIVLGVKVPDLLGHCTLCGKELPVISSNGGEDTDKGEGIGSFVLR